MTPFLGSMTKNDVSSLIPTILSSSKTRSFTTVHPHHQQNIRCHASHRSLPSLRASSRRPTNFFLLPTPTPIRLRANGTWCALLLRKTRLYLRRASRTAGSLWNSSPSIMMTFSTMPRINASSCSTTNLAILPPPRLLPQHICYVPPTHPRIMPSVTVWFHSDAGSISLTATPSSMDHSTLLLSGLAKLVTGSVSLTGMSYCTISPSTAINPHALISPPTPFMSTEISTLPPSINHALSSLWRLQQTAPTTVLLPTKGCGLLDSFNIHKPHFLIF